MIKGVGQVAVYPRWCGELECVIGFGDREFGLSPLVRGTLDGDRRGIADCRFIPAGAGNSQGETMLAILIAVYPRWCGELQNPRARILVIGGLSPLVRGTWIQAAVDAHIKRFIPAGAGNSGEKIRMGRVVPVYPRWCGELPVNVRIAKNIGGLSPLVRGTRAAMKFGFAPARFIPAGAGNSMASPASDNYRPVYPRWCGELLKIPPKNQTRNGLSPLVRGTLARINVLPVPHRFIPAGAGNSRAQPQ